MESAYIGKNIFPTNKMHARAQHMVLRKTHQGLILLGGFLGSMVMFCAELPFFRIERRTSKLGESRDWRIFQ